MAQLDVITVVNNGLALLVIVLGFSIIWRAYQGARRNDSRAMLLLAIGLLFITVIPSIIEILLPIFARFVTPASPAIDYTIIASRASEATGIGILLYSLHSK